MAHSADDEGAGSAESQLRAKLTAEWDVRGIELATMDVDPKGTIVPSLRALTADQQVNELPALSTIASEAGQAHIELASVLGEGGMGVVWAATQTPLQREIAVKSLRPEAVGDTAMTGQLLREARIAGALQHPNLVPIHTIGRDEEDRPLIVMKRIEGTSWQELLDEQRQAGPGAAMRRLVENLRRLIEVAKAVHFAHCKGIVHRDLKPENVMIGSFGEVYLVDWGIAVSTRRDGIAGVPLASEVDRVTGTPAYMAPEMACGDGPRIDARTDVYLLGAVLHDLLTDAPPHDGGSIMMMLTRAYASAPQDYDSTVPHELAMICHRAMHREREHRYQTAAAFANALELFLQHRDSVLLGEQSALQLEELREQLSVGSAAREDKAKLYNCFNACRFGFSHALQIWIGNTRAREQLQEALEMMIEFELTHGSAGAAAALLPALPISQPNLARRVDDKRTAEGRAATELERMRREADPTVGDRTRAVAAFVVGGLWLPCHALLALLADKGWVRLDHLMMALSYGLLLVGVLIAGYAVRKRLTANASGLRTQLTMIIMYGAMTASWPIGETIGTSLNGSFALLAFVGFVVAAVGALAVDRRFSAWSVPMFAALWACITWPSLSLWWVGAAGTFGGLILGYLRITTTSAEQVRPLSQRWARPEAEAATLRHTKSRRDAAP